MQVILPKTYVGPEALDGPLFFLAGPVRGGGDWQAECCRLLEESLSGKFAVAVPCRYGPEHPLYACRAEGKEGEFGNQTLWERHYLDVASASGCILAWLPCESKAKPRDDGQPYSRDSYGEVGEWRGRLMYDRSLRFILGAEPGFPGLEVIRRNFHDALGSDFPIYGSLRETAQAAAETVVLRQEPRLGTSLILFAIEGMPENDRAVELLEGFKRHEPSLAFRLVPCGRSMGDMYECPFVRVEEDGGNYYGLKGIESLGDQYAEQRDRNILSLKEA